MNKSHFIGALIAVLFVFISAEARAATVIWGVDGTGQLTGARNVNVNGTLYDVSFVDGLCINEFNGCDQTADFSPFTTEASATAAANALMSQVILDTGLGDGSPDSYDSNPEKTFGCENSTLCSLLIPYETSIDTSGTPLVNYASALNHQTELFDATNVTKEVNLNQVINGDILAHLDINRPNVYAKFQLAPPIPLPAAFWLFGSGLLGLIGMARRKKAA